jgi:hypothetical protein
MYDRGEIMTEDERNNIIKYILKKDTLHATTEGTRADYRFDLTTKNIPVELFKIKQRILEREGLRGYETHTNFDDLVTFVLPGGKITRHTDKNSFDGLIHVRFNVFVQVPKVCNAFYDGILVDAKERHYVMCRSGIDPHWTDVNTDTISRIVISYGFMLPFNKVEQLYKIPAEHYTSYRGAISLRYLLYTALDIGTKHGKCQITF